MDKIKVGVIGFGRMGELYLRSMRESGRWEIVYICDVSPVARKEAAAAFPEVTVIGDEDIIFNDSDIQAFCVG